MFNLTRHKLTPFPVGGPHILSGQAQYISVNAGAFASGLYPVANRCYFMPFHLDEPTVISKLWVLNGATASGNFDIGIYSAGHLGPESLLVSSGSTAQSGTDTYQLIDITDRLFPAGDYYLAIVMDNTTGTIYRVTTNASIMALAGWYQKNSTFPLPAPTVGTVVPNGTGQTPAIGYLCNGRATL